MAISIEIPEIGTTAEEQSRYLYRLAEQLNYYLNSVEDYALDIQASSTLRANDLAYRLEEVTEQERQQLIDYMHKVADDIRLNADTIKMDTESLVERTSSEILAQVGRTYIAESTSIDATTGSEFHRSLTEMISAAIQITADAITQTFATKLLVNDSIRELSEEISTYIRSDINGITIGRSDSAFQTVLSNSKLSFMQGDAEVAYISNHKLFITEATITDRFVLGNFQWVIEDNGSLSLVYISGG